MFKPKDIFVVNNYKYKVLFKPTTTVDINIYVLFYIYFNLVCVHHCSSPFYSSTMIDDTQTVVKTLKPQTMYIFMYV